MSKLTATMGSNKSHLSTLAFDSMGSGHVGAGPNTLDGIVADTIRAAARLVQQLRARRLERRRMWESYNELRGLDDHTLRDLGFHRSELMSVAAEVSGAAERTRGRVQVQQRLFP